MKLPAHILFEKHARELGLACKPEFRFHEQRKWRFDFLLGRLSDCEQADRFLSLGIAVEIEGAIWSHGRHTRGKGFQADLDKYNHATLMGYRVLRFSTQDVLRGRARAFLQEYLGDGSAKELNRFKS